MRRIRDAVIGDDHQLEGLFGPRRITYADHTASASRRPPVAADAERLSQGPRR